MTADEENPSGETGSGKGFRGPGALEDLIIALQFLTRLPVPIQTDWRPGRLARAAWAFPLAGLVAGSLGAGVFWLTVLAGLGPTIAAILTVAAGLLITGALHEDGLVDVADGLGGGHSRARKLEIMRDSRIGTYGAAALVLVLVLKTALLARIGAPATVFLALAAAGALSRSAVVVVMTLLPQARTDGRSAEAGRPARSVCALAVVLGAVPLALLGTPGLGALAAAGIVLLLWGVLAQRQVGGQTGDILGGAQVVTDLTVLLVLAAGLA